jgi:cysteine-S-conjugate beta-lyase
MADVDLSVPDLDELLARRSAKWCSHEAGVLSSTIAEMDFPLAPPAARALRAAIDRDDLGYAPGNPERLAEAFAQFAGRRLHWRVDPGQVTLVPDVMIGLIELCRVLTSPGERVAFATPAYPPFFSELAHHDRELVRLPLRADRTLDLDSLERALNGGVRVLVLPNPHNPTGHVYSRRELERIANVCHAHDAWVLANEIHAPLVLDGATHTPWLEVSDIARERGIALTSASKAFNLTAGKTALIVTASDRARDAVRRLPKLTDHAGLLGVIAAEAAFTDGDDWLDAVLRRLTANRTLLDDRLAAELPEIDWTPPDATYLAWLDCRRLNLGDNPAATFLTNGRVALSPGLDYGAEGAGFVRLNFGTSPEHLIEIVRRMRHGAGRSEHRHTDRLSQSVK